MSPLILLLTCFWWGGLARTIDYEISPSTQPINDVYENTDLKEGDANVIIETGVLTGGTFDAIHNLQIVDVQQHSINLTWTDFIPDEYEEGVYVLAVSTSTDWTQAEWDYILIGRLTHYTLKNLKAATTYLLRVAVYETMVYNLSDIIMAHTLPVTHCVYQDVIYPVNQYSIHVGENTCICMESGEFTCSPLEEFAGSTTNIGLTKSMKDAGCGTVATISLICFQCALSHHYDDSWHIYNACCSSEHNEIHKYCTEIYIEHPR